MTIVLESFVLLSHVRRHAVPVEQSPKAQQALALALCPDKAIQVTPTHKAAGKGIQTLHIPFTQDDY